ncbi:MAG: imidazole glycerol phosphate synthase subunit HisH [Lachnospiraceae bacterium]|nr:imidazole glycerol phosphate synthase subunit HisH [Lachnospiraceae bacterium]
MIAIIDYDAGNIKSVEKALEYLRADYILTKDPSALMAADHVILPGVGAFGDAMDKIRSSGLVPVINRIIQAGTPFLGVCLGLQLLFEESEEAPGIPGLGILKGRILKIPRKEGLKIPQIGWNSLQFPNRGRLFDGIDENSFVYFVHSYYLKADDPSIVTATCEYGVTVHASVESGNIFACQFHPEKSSETGLWILRNFIAVQKEG